MNPSGAEFNPVVDHHQYSKSKKSFFFGRKKKRKPVCTCHLAYATPDQPVVRFPVESNADLDQFSGGQSSTFSGQNNYLQNSSMIPYPTESQQNGFWNQPPTQTTESLGTHHFHHHGQPPSSSLIMENHQPQVPHHHHQELFSAMNPSPSRFSRTFLPSQYQPQMQREKQQQQQTGSCRYSRHYDTSTNGQQLIYSNNVTYTPDLNLHRRLHGGTGTSGTSNEQTMMMIQRQRRWSDGNNGLSQTDREAIRQEAEIMSTYMVPQHKDFVTCQCGHCPGQMMMNDFQMMESSSRKSKPKVSFGSLMMYPMEEPADLPDRTPKKNSKLTTELLPLDTQIPLQMMGDSALICRIL